VTCLHTESQVTSTVDAVVEELKRLGDQSLFRGRKNSESE
jgi:hypothetical protein